MELEKKIKSKKPIIWALYDDAESSYKQGIERYFHGQFEVHSIGINNIKFEKSDFYFYHKIDLSLSNFSLISNLKELPKPDIILASPPCESWSGADCAGKMFRSIDKNGNWVVMNSKYYEDYNKKAHPVKRRFFPQKERGRILGESTIGATIEIINFFKPKVWVIENPQTSKSWEFQKFHWNFEGIETLAYYSSYDANFSLKPTIFKSNIALNLSTTRVKGNNDHMARGSYSKRSSIPIDLIKSIINQIFKNINSETP
jgi:hypothetical protein